MRKHISPKLITITQYGTRSTSRHFQGCVSEASATATEKCQLDTGELLKEFEATLTLIYTLNHKRCQYICDHNSGKSRSIFVSCVLL